MKKSMIEIKRVDKKGGSEEEATQLEFFNLLIFKKSIILMQLNPNPVIEFDNDR